ncbi:hypothetical protein C8R45DRAFT_982764 [Mycena sanguinolenta]|nr:hypothetical protein C8R45DRAFT_982764 [Mycena sanguinolenta]
MRIISVQFFSIFPPTFAFKRNECPPLENLDSKFFLALQNHRVSLGGNFTGARLTSRKGDVIVVHGQGIQKCYEYIREGVRAAATARFH